MNILASQQLDEPAKGLSPKCAREDIEVITNWLMDRDTNGECFLQYRGIVMIMRMVVRCTLPVLEENLEKIGEFYRSATI